MRATLLSITTILLLFISFCSYAEDRALIFGTDANYPPFENTDYATGEIVGYDIDLVHALCNVMQVQCKIINVPFTDLLHGLRAGRYDAVIRAISITPARKKLVDFTNPYFEEDGSFVAATSARLDGSKEQLRNKVIGVQVGTTFEHYLKAKYSDAAYIKTYENFTEALHDLTTHNVDVVLGDAQAVSFWLQNQHNANYQIIGKTIYDRNIFGNGFGIAVKKGNTGLLNALNQALAEIEQDGTYLKITRTYFHF